ncbi:hypothetical protein ACP70R_000514 [Stipagrostis hirtigluma subsp. patula]
MATAAAASGSRGAARGGRKRESGAQCGCDVCTAARAGAKPPKWTGVRYRHWGRWASEIRIPRSRSRVWIGTFGSPVEAALAYDAAVYCFYGAHPRKPHRFNFPEAPRPGVPEHVRLHLTPANIKAVAVRYANDLADYVPPPPQQQPVLPAAVPPAAAGADAAAGGDGGAAAAAGDNHGVVDGADGLDLINLDDIVSLMALLQNDQFY